jgi:Zn-dependent protease with chaperone function
MRMQWHIGLLACLVLAGCAGAGLPGTERAPVTAAATAATASALPPEIAARNFITVVQQVEPLAESVCVGAGRVSDCDFQIVIDDRPGQPPNAFQTVDGNGRPIIAFTLSLIATAQNRDELAFVMGHEAGHHIAGHLGRSQGQAMQGAVLAGVLATLSGAS